MSHNMASRVFEVRSAEEKCHDYTATLEDGLQADSLSEFLRAAILGLGVVLGASAAVYLSFLAISLLFVSLVK
jgi:hypothetical protein